jgi:hypothetical protein
MERGYRTADGREAVVSAYDYAPGTFRADVAVPSVRHAGPTADDAALGIVDTFERFTWADFRGGDAVEVEHYEPGRGATWNAAVILTATPESILYAEWPGWVVMCGPDRTMRHAVELSAPRAERVAAIRERHGVTPSADVVAPVAAVAR